MNNLKINLENNPFISVIMPVYNSEKFLKDALNSLLEQSFIDIEILLINDGSTDNSGEICNEYSSIDKRIKVYHTDNNGQGAARNFAVKCSKGKYIAFVDSDDLFDKEYLRTLVDGIKNNNVDISFCVS